MIEIISDENVKRIENLAEKLDELKDPEKLRDLQILGKHSAVLLDYDTGLGMTVEDLAKNHPDDFKEYSNIVALHDIAEEIISGAFK